MIEVIKKLEYVPGMRTFHSELLRGHETVVNRKRLGRLMQELNLIATYRVKIHVNDRQCTFIGAYKREVLGGAMSRKTDVELARTAYVMMKEGHGSELDKAGVLIHSDQGSQYTSTTASSNPYQGAATVRTTHRWCHSLAGSRPIFSH